MHVSPLPREPTLPSPLTALIGREREIVGVRALLLRDDVRLVTLTGAGGVGKTRLAIATAETVQHDVDLLRFVGLQAIADPAQVPAAIARALGVPESGEGSVLDRVAAFIAPRRALLILDTFEHLLPAVEVVSHLMVACPALTVLVTSRAVLNISGEHVFTVWPLTVPSSTHLDPLAALDQFAAVRLFADRATAASDSFRLTPENAPAVAAICRRLDGLPLALELAAARSRVVPVTALLAQLDQHHDVLSGGPSDAPERLRSMRGTVAWSYDLLAPVEQRLFERLALFRGGSTAEAVAAVAGDVAGSPASLFDGIASLVDKSLVQAISEPHGDTRYAMLDTIREFGLERMEAGGQAAIARDRHAAYFLALAEQAAPALISAERHPWLRRLDADYPNLCAALEWSIASGNGARGLRLAGALVWYWYHRGQYLEGLDCLDRALTIAEPADALAAYAEAIAGIARLAYYSGDIPRAAEAATQSIKLLHALGDPRQLGHALIVHVAAVNAPFEVHIARLRESRDLFRQSGDGWGAATAQLYEGAMTTLKATTPEQLQRACADLESAVAVFRSLHDHWQLSGALSYLGLVCEREGVLDRARRYHEESAAYARLTDDVYRMRLTINRLADLLFGLEEYEQAARLYAECLAASERTGVAEFVAYERERLGLTRIEQGALEDAEAHLHAALATYRDIGDLDDVVVLLQGLGTVAHLRGDFTEARARYHESLILTQELWDVALCAGVLVDLALSLSDPPGPTPKAMRAVQLLAAAKALRAAEAVRPSLADCRRFERAAERLAHALSARAFQQAWAEGGALTMHDAIALALAARQPVHPTGTSAATGLTEREIEVLQLLAAGRSNREIAGLLYLSVRTIERHVANIYVRIDAHNRADATAFAYRHHLMDTPA